MHRQPDTSGVSGLTGVAFLGLRSRRVVYKECVQRQAVRQDVVPDVVATDTQRIHLNRVLVLDRHLHRLQVRVHADVDTCIQVAAPHEGATTSWRRANRIRQATQLKKQYGFEKKDLCVRHSKRAKYYITLHIV